MSYDHSRHENRLRASALFHELKGQLPESAASTIDVKTMTAASSLQWWRLSKVVGVHVFQEDDGWHADVVFNDLPRECRRSSESPNATGQGRKR